ncbi:MAG TPA: hypothetical protein VIG55_00860 [Methylosinus sp.]
MGKVTLCRRKIRASLECLQYTLVYGLAYKNAFRDMTSGKTGGRGPDISESAAAAAKMEDDVQQNVSSTEATETSGVVTLGVATPVAQPIEASQPAAAAEVADGFILHVRFRSDGTIWMIDECPAHMTGQEWYNFLCRRIPDRYAPRMGGRGDFRVSRAQLEALKARNPN